MIYILSSARAQWYPVKNCGIERRTAEAVNLGKINKGKGDTLSKQPRALLTSKPGTMRANMLVCRRHIAL